MLWWPLFFGAIVIEIGSVRVIALAIRRRVFAIVIDVAPLVLAGGDIVVVFSLVVLSCSLIFGGLYVVIFFRLLLLQFWLLSSILRIGLCLCQLSVSTNGFHD